MEIKPTYHLALKWPGDIDTVTDEDIDLYFRDHNGIDRWDWDGSDDENVDIHVYGTKEALESVKDNLEYWHPAEPPKKAGLAPFQYNVEAPAKGHRFNTSQSNSCLDCGGYWAALSSVCEPRGQAGLSTAALNFAHGIEKDMMKNYHIENCSLAKHPQKVVASPHPSHQLTPNGGCSNCSDTGFNLVAKCAEENWIKRNCDVLEEELNAFVARRRAEIEDPPVCECGAAKTGIAPYAMGHSTWCDVATET